MAVGPQKAWSVTAASNGAADSNINLAEGQTPASLNDAGRAVMAGVKGWLNQISAAKTTGGSANAQTLTSDAVAAISTAYAAGMLFCVKAGYTNSTTTPTFNVDSVGAKTVKKGGAQAALAASDIVAGGVYWLAYESSGDCFLLLNPESGQIAAQPLDATLTALAALSWSSGNALMQFTAADTVSLTLTPSVTSATATQTTNTAHSVTAKNTADNAAVAGIRVEGDRATPAANDQIYVSYYLSDSAGNQDEFGRITLQGDTVTSASEEGSMRFSVITAGAIAHKLRMNGGSLAPIANSGLNLGTSSLSFGSLFLASGGVINWNNGNATLTHSTGLITSNVPIQAGMALSTETTGTITSASANKYIDCSGGVTFPNSVFTAGQWQFLVAGSAARTLTRGASIAMYVNGTDSASATLAARGTGLGFWDGASTLYLSGDIA